ncbi:MAG TPA: pantoate--beta-alanine ligase, partial [Methylophilaceae bacterium]|nr:pantoate--beta-alanine ligase [Methylophilaceae bacterium]
MQRIHTVAELRRRLAAEPSVSLVPTMGNLHAGHIHLVELARSHGHCVVVSIFVNPLQFGANEDLASYPRTLQQDCAKLEAAGTDVVFAPSEQE